MYADIYSLQTENVYDQTVFDAIVVIPGEMLPPSFTYFMDLDEFLRKYPHVGLKLGEEGKHLLHSFIEGKIEVYIYLDTK